MYIRPTFLVGSLMNGAASSLPLVSVYSNMCPYKSFSFCSSSVNPLIDLGLLEAIFLVGSTGVVLILMLALVTSEMQENIGGSDCHTRMAS